MANKVFCITHGVTPEHNCKFDGACYGEICIDNELCLKKEEDLTDEEREQIRKFNEKWRDGTFCGLVSVILPCRYLKP